MSGTLSTIMQTTSSPSVIITYFDSPELLIETVYHPNHISTITKYHHDEDDLADYLATLAIDPSSIKYDFE